MKTESITFENQEGLELSGGLDLAHGRERACALFAHCFTCGKDLASHRRIARELAERGITVLRLDFTAIGESEGTFVEKDFFSNVSDLVAAAKYLEEHRQPPQLLIGHSLGGVASVFAAGKLSGVNAVTTIATPDDPSHIKTRLPSAMDEIQEQGEATITLGGKNYTIGREFVESLEEADLKQELRNLGRPLLLMHSPKDQVVGIDSATAMYQAALHPKSFICLDGADHLLSGQDDPRFAGRMIASWADRYLEYPEESEPDRDRSHVTVYTGRDNYYTEINAGPHEMVADEPVSSGGTDRGPDPYGFLVSGLGACTSMTLRMYADRKEWPLDGVEVNLEHERVHAEDCDECETESGQVDRVKRHIRLEGDLTDEQRDRLIEIAGKCPVHRTLTTETVVETVEVE